MPDDVALKCFGAALKKQEQGLDDEQKIEILKKRWSDIKVNIMTLNEVPKFTAKMQALADERDCEWLVEGEYYYYINHTMCEVCYDDQEMIIKEVFLKDKIIMNLAKEYSKKHGWGEEEFHHFYTALLAIVAIRCKFVAMLDFDRYGVSGWLRWIYLSLYENRRRYDRLKTRVWLFAVESRKGKVISRIDYLLDIDRKMTEEVED